MEKKLIILLAIVSVLLLSSFFLFRHEIRDLQSLYASTQDTVKYWKNKNGENVAKISVLETDKARDFIKMATKDSTIKELQELVKKYKKQLNNGGSATIIQTITEYDTTYVSTHHLDTIYFPTSTVLDSISNRWIKSRFGFVNGNTVFSLNVVNDYSLVIGEESRGLFRKKEIFAEVTNHNPYTTTKTLRTYQVAVQRQKRWGIGPNFSVSAIPVLTGGSQFLQFLPTVGIGVQYNFINF